MVKKIKIRSPIPWFWGKYYMRNKILPIFGLIPHSRYIEPFGGGASILIAKEPVGVETYNDIDGALYDFFTVIADPDTFDEFIRRVSLLPSSRQLYNEYSKEWMNESNKVKRAAMWYTMIRQSFSGHHSWAITVSRTHNGMSGSTSAWLGAHDLLLPVHNRLQRVQIENKSWESVVLQHDHVDALFYCDPPYLLSSRKSGGYTNEMSHEDHIRLIDVLNGVKAKVALSGYPSHLYSSLVDCGWREYSWNLPAASTAKTQNTQIRGRGAMTKKEYYRIENLWINPPAITSMSNNGLSGG